MFELAPIKAVLFDFDGPICDVFAGYSAPSVARELERVAGRDSGIDDPHEVLRNAAGSPVLDAVEDALVAAELTAVESAVAAAGGLESVRVALDAGLRVGVVSNNVGAAVERFLFRVGMAGPVWPVVGRPYRAPERMKPDMWPLETALDAIKVERAEVVFVGDSRTDVEAAKKSHLRCVALANKAGKRAMFEAAGADAIVDDMDELRESLEAL